MVWDFRFRVWRLWGQGMESWVRAEG